MLEYIKSTFLDEGIDRIGLISIDECDIINERILPEWAKSVIMFAIPYRSVLDKPEDGFSEYARIYDYHKFASSLYERIINKLSAGTNCKFQGFCDHSPINEKLAIAKCGLGVIGRNSLFIDDVYGSFVFIGSLITDAEFKTEVFEIKSCDNCGLCIAACPNSAIAEKGIERQKCLSAISQKKNKTEEEKALLNKHKIAWGCDICQLACPHNIKAKISPIPYFSETRIKHIDRELISSMTDEEFKKYAFSYKGRDIVINNIDLI